MSFFKPYIMLTKAMTTKLKKMLHKDLIKKKKR